MYFEKKFYFGYTSYFYKAPGFLRLRPGKDSKVSFEKSRTEHKYAFHFEMVDVSAASAGDWTLDDSQRAKLTELQECLGLKGGRWTPIGMLGVLLAAGGCAQLDENPCFSVVLRACKDAHREELLAQSGSLF